MLKKLNVTRDLNPAYFWDVDISLLDADRSKRMIIERVFTLGTVKEIMLVINYYGAKEVGEVLRKLNYIDPKTLNFVSRFFNIPLKEFRCFSRQPLSHTLWNS